MFVDVNVLLSAILVSMVAIDVIGAVVAISSNRTLEYAEEFSHFDVLVAVLTFYLKMLMMLISFICEVNWCCFKMFFDRLVTDE
jgi:hypothetical protein